MKEGMIQSGDIPCSEQELEQINRFSRRALTAAEVYTFSVVLCDNEIDRDSEQFSIEALGEMAELFIGRTGIFDHSMKGKDQKARVYSTKLEQVAGRRNRVGEPYCRLNARAYMLRTHENDTLIAEIDAGIKKEVSVGVSVESTLCSVCGSDLKKEGCAHRPGQRYEGKLCYHILNHALDAYEWSFVAVPAQPGAGVIKAFKAEKGECKSMNEILETLKSADEAITVSRSQRRALLDMICTLEQEAALGREYKKALRTQVLALLPLAMPEMDCKVFGHMAEVMTVEELKSFRQAFETRKHNILPPVRQLMPEEQTDKQGFDAFKI